MEWLPCWLVLSLVFHNITCKKGLSQGEHQGLGRGDSPGLDKGENPGLDRGDSPGLNEGENPGLGRGDIPGLDKGENPGLDHGDSPGLDKGENPGLGRGDSPGLDKGENPGLGRGDIPGLDKGKNPGLGRGDSPGLDKGKNPGLGRGDSPGLNKGKNPGLGECQNRYKRSKSNKRGVSDTTFCMEVVNSILQNGNHSDTLEAMKSLEEVLEDTEVNETTSMSVSRLVAILYKPKNPFTGLTITANDNEAMSDKPVTNSKVRVQLPRELNAGSDNTIVFCMLTWPETNGTIFGTTDVLYESRLVGLSVRGKKISGLQEHVNITMNLIINGTQKPSCVFFNFSTNAYSRDGCQTEWDHGQSHVTCSCNHLTYFGVLMVSSPSLSSTDRQIQSYITLIGCSLSLLTLIITVLLFITNRKVRADVSMKVHINLAIALILLNVHFLPSQMVAALSSTGLCVYMALSLHYSLLATFSWMALEGFHLYLLLVKVFNIYVRKYLLKLSLVGWGMPAVIVFAVVIIDRSTYGSVPMELSNPNSTAICYIANTTVKMVTTVGVFGLVFVFNVIMLGVTVRRVVSLHKSKEFGQRDRDRAKRDICTLLGVTTLLGITWGLVFFSFGYLTTPGLYLFCILNSLQGFFIFLWFLMSLRKTGSTATTKMSNETRSTNS